MSGHSVLFEPHQACPVGRINQPINLSPISPRRASHHQSWSAAHSSVITSSDSSLAASYTTLIHRRRFQQDRHLSSPKSDPHSPRSPLLRRPSLTALISPRLTRFECRKARRGISAPSDTDCHCDMYNQFNDRQVCFRTFSTMHQTTALSSTSIAIHFCQTTKTIHFHHQVQLRHFHGHSLPSHDLEF